MSNSFIKSAIIKLVIILISILMVEKNIFGQEIFFEDSFSANEIDTLKWNTSIATSGKRWCPTTWPENHHSVPGEWIDISIQPFHGVKQTPPYGTILMSSGNINFGADVIRAFPYIWAGLPSRPSAFPIYGDFILEVRMKYTENSPAGDGVVALNWKNSDPIGNNPPVPPGQRVFSLWGGSKAPTVCLVDSVPIYIIDQFVFHDYKLEYIDGEYSLFVDGILKRGPLKNSVRPNSIWIGNPVFTYGFLVNWSDFTIDYIRVTAPSMKSPQILAVTDVPHDQGSKVTLKWHASALDSNLTTLPFYSI